MCCSCYYIFLVCFGIFYFSQVNFLFLGVVTLTDEYKICNVGDVLSPEQAQVLVSYNLRMVVKINIYCASSLQALISTTTIKG